jgi:phosphate transport system protein
MVMLRKLFDQEIQNAKDEVLVLGSMVEDAIISSIQALQERDFEAASQILENDANINEKRFDIESRVMALIATQQPMAHDLRVLASIFEIAAELERIGDYAKGIALLCIRIGNQPLVKSLIDLPLMAELSTNMLRRALEAFVAEDLETALAIPKEDDQVDNLYLQFYRVMMTYVMENPLNIDESNYLLWIAHNLERTADRVSNICERTVFIVTGKMSELDGPRIEEISVQ